MATIIKFIPPMVLEIGSSEEMIISQNPTSSVNYENGSIYGLLAYLTSTRHYCCLAFLPPEGDLSQQCHSLFIFAIFFTEKMRFLFLNFYELWLIIHPKRSHTHTFSFLFNHTNLI